MLGLGHEHQRSTLWKLVENFINEDKMKTEVVNQYGDWKDEHAEDGGFTEKYDRNSIMHYWYYN